MEAAVNKQLGRPTATKEDGWARISQGVYNIVNSFQRVSCDFIWAGEVDGFHLGEKKNKLLQNCKRSNLQRLLANPNQLLYYWTCWGY